MNDKAKIAALNRALDDFMPITESMSQTVRAVAYAARAAFSAGYLAAPATPTATADSAAVDYKLLLAKYIEHINAEEGSDSINCLYRNSSDGWDGMSDKVTFSQLEKEALDEASEVFAAMHPTTGGK